MKQTIEFFIHPKTIGLDLTGPLEVFNTASLLLANEGKTDMGYTACFSAFDVGEIELSSGLCVKAGQKIGNGAEPDIFIVPGCMEVDRVTRDEKRMEHIRAAALRAKRIVSVCNGALILAKAGLLDGKKATTHWLMTEAMQNDYPNVDVLPDAIYVQDGNVATSAGVTAGIDLALALVEEDHGARLALDIARALVLYLRRSGGQSQFSPPLQSQQKAGTRFQELHDWLLENIEKPLSVEDMADRTRMSLRNFFRVFTTQTGITPGKYLETLRVDRARELLESGEDVLPNVAQICGFGREDRLRRAFVNRFHITPAQYRIHFGKKKAAA